MPNESFLYAFLARRSQPEPTERLLLGAGAAGEAKKATSAAGASAGSIRSRAALSLPSPWPHHGEESAPTVQKIGCHDSKYTPKRPPLISNGSWRLFPCWVAHGKKSNGEAVNACPTLGLRLRSPSLICDTFHSGSLGALSCNIHHLLYFAWVIFGILCFFSG